MNTANQRRRKRDGILIVEDEQLVAWDIEQILRDNGFDLIHWTPSLRGARALLENRGNGITLVILDLKLEDGDGTELVEDFSRRGIPILVVTGYSSFCQARVHVLAKPFLSADLVDAVNSLLGGQG